MAKDKDNINVIVDTGKFVGREDELEYIGTLEEEKKEEEEKIKLLK